jgi:hypothetical protein
LPLNEPVELGVHSGELVLHELQRILEAIGLLRIALVQDDCISLEQFNVLFDVSEKPDFFT